MYYTRPVASRRIEQSVLRSLVVMLIAMPLAARQSTDEAPRIWQAVVAAAAVDPLTAATVSALLNHHDVRREVVAARSAPVKVTFIVPDANSDDTDRLVSATATALTRLDEWLGPLPARELTVVDAPWHAGVAGASFPGVAITSTRWLSTSRDMAFERPLVAALARQYTFSLTAPGDGAAWFEEGVALYLGTRLIHEQLEGRNFDTPRFFGGFVPFTLRPVLNSPSPTDPRPRLRHVPDVEEPSEAPWRAAPARSMAAQRAAAALHAFERYEGWPAFQQSLQRFMERFRSRPASPADFAATVSEVRGRDVSWYFDAAFNVDTRFDYAIADLRNEPGDHGFRSTVTVRRVGSAVFAGTSEPRLGEIDRSRALPVLIQFDDDTEITEWIDGRDEQQVFEYRGPSPAVLASVDPDAMLLLDEDRTNNTRTIRPRYSRLGVRLAMSWVIWLQDAMLACTGVL